MPVRLPFRAAGALVVALWVPYTVLNSLYPGPVLTYAAGLLLALAGALALALAGEAVGTVTLAPPLRGGAWGVAGLGCVAPAAGIVHLLGGGPAHWAWSDVLVYAPASALSQELYFRATLLPVLVRLCGGRIGHAMALQALLFALWHARALWTVPFAAALAVLAGTFAVGLLWGWQVRRDRTVLYVAAQHALFLAIV